MRVTHKPSAAELHQEVSDWRRRTQNIAPARNSHRQGTQRMSPYNPCVIARPTEGRRTQSIYSPKGTSRCDSNIKINLNFEGRAYELQSDVAELQRQLRLKDRDHQLLLHEYEESKNLLERKLEMHDRKETMQNQHISQLELVVRQLKARLVTKNSRQSPVMRFNENQLPHHFPTESGKKLEGSALACDRSTTKIAGSALKRSTFGDCQAAYKEQPSSQPTAVSIQQQQQRYSQVRPMYDASELKLRSLVSTPVSDKNIQIKLVTEEEAEIVALNQRLQRQVKDLSATVTALTRSNDELKDRLRASQLNNLKISEFKEQIDRFAERLLQKEVESTQLGRQLEEAHTQNDTMRQLIEQQQNKLARMDELAVMVDTLTRENNNLKKQTMQIETHYEQLMEEIIELRIVQDEASKLKSNNLELVVQSANEIEAISKLTMLCQAIQKSIERVAAGSRMQSATSSPIKTQEISAIMHDSLRVEQSFVTDGLRNHEAHMQVVNELQNNLKRILQSMKTLQEHHVTTVEAEAKKSVEVEQLKLETQEMIKELEQQRSLTNSLLLETKQMRRTIEMLKANMHEGQELVEQAKSCRKRKQRCQTAVIANGHERQLSSIEQRPEEQHNTEQDAHSSVRSMEQIKSRSDQNSQHQDQHMDTIVEMDADSIKSISRQPINRTSLLFDRSNLNDMAMGSVQVLPSRPNLKAMSFKELSYTLLSEFCDKNDQRTLFTNLMEETVCRYFELESSTIGKAVLEFLNNMYSFPNHTFLAEKASILLQQLKDFSISAKREVASLEEAIESYVQNVSPVFINDAEHFYEDDETEQAQTSQNRHSNTVRSDVNISIHQRSTLRNQLEGKNSDLSSVTDLLQKGLTDTITRLRRRSTISRQSISSNSSNSSKAT